jgi:hypothetical protein
MGFLLTPPRNGLRFFIRPGYGQTLDSENEILDIGRVIRPRVAGDRCTCHREKAPQHIRP